MVPRAIIGNLWYIGYLIFKQLKNNSMKKFYWSKNYIGIVWWLSEIVFWITTTQHLSGQKHTSFYLEKNMIEWLESKKLDESAPSLFCLSFYVPLFFLSFILRPCLFVVLSMFLFSLSFLFRLFFLYFNPIFVFFLLVFCLCLFLSIYLSFSVTVFLSIFL